MTRRSVVVALVALMFTTAAPAFADQIRGAWLGAWWNGYFTASQVDATIAAAKKCGVTDLFIQVRKNADSLYNSKLEPKVAQVAADFDPLACTIEKAHAQGIKVHAWVNAFRVGSAKPSADPKHVVNQHPEWVNKTVDGGTLSSSSIYLDPGVPEAREYTAKIILDIATRYDVDGIQWDYIRFPDSKFGYSDAALKCYYAETGASSKPDVKDPKWVQWKRDQVTKLVRDVYKRVKAIKPKMVISASTITWGSCPADFPSTEAYWRVGQDWKAWMAEGIIDVNLPMVYKTEGSAKGAQSFRGWLTGLSKWNGGKQTYVGIDVDNNNDAGVLAQMEAVKKAGLEGSVLYKFNDIPRRTSLIEALTAPKP